MKNTLSLRSRLDNINTGKSKIVEQLLFAWAVTLIPFSLLTLYFGYQYEWRFQSQLEIAVISAMWLIILSRKFWTPEKRALAIAIIITVALLGEVYDFGLLVGTPVALAIFPVLGAVIGGLRIGLIGIGTFAIALIAIAWSTITTEKMPPADLPEVFWSVDEWALRVILYVISTLVGVWVCSALYRLQQDSIEALSEQNAVLEKSQSQITQSAKLAGLGHAVTDQISEKVLECDETYAQMHGLTAEEFTSLDVRSGIIGSLVHEDDRGAALEHRERLLNGEALISEIRHKLPNGKVRYLRKIFRPITSSDPDERVFDVVSQDVTDARQLQQKLFNAQKLDAIGKLTGGVAHDFNNLLAVIMGNLELLDDMVASDEEKELIQNGIEATMRGAELTRNMLSFARKAQLEPTIIDLNHVVRNLKNWTVRTLPSTIEVETSLLAGLWLVEVDASSVESGVLNLILNARDAMPDGGRLTIETSNVRIDEEYVDVRGEELTPGRFVLLAVSDTGEGILKEHLDKIFEPFFTTKPVGSGSGLGLSMIEGFIRQSGGIVRVYSEPGVGTTFKLYFPAVTDNSIVERSASRTELTSAKDNLATILLVEDNAEVLAAMHTILSNSGYRVFNAVSGDDALKVFKSEPEIDLLLTDIVMPGDLQGTTLAKALRKIRPALPVVFMSGYASEATVHGNGLRPEDIRLMKPARRHDLLRAIDEALAQKRVQH